jgi:adhesin HecA-like repeat protein
VDITDLSVPERLVWQAFTRGTWVDLREGDPVADGLQAAPQWGPERVIRAEVLGALLLGAREPEPGFAPGVRLRGARITGRLDLMSATLAHPLVCEYCYFTEEPRFVECSARTVRIVCSRLPAFDGTRMRLTGILNLWRSTVTGVLRLDQARLEGQLCLSEAAIGAAGGSEAVAAYGLAVDGGLECSGLHAHGSVAMDNAAVTGTVNLADAHIARPGGRALTMDRAVVGGLDWRRMVVEGETRMRNSRVGSSMVLTAARLDNPGGMALSAGGLNAAGGVFLNGAFAATGEIRLYGASLSANLTVSGGTVRNPGGTALNLDRATVGVFRGDGLVAEGQVNLMNARIASDFDLTNARLTGDGGRPVLAADGASVDGALVLAGLHADGEICLRTVQVGQRILLLDSRLANPGGTALRLSRAKVAADVFCERMTAAGRVRVAGAAIGGELSFREAKLRNGTGTALDAAALDAGELSLRLAEPAEGLVDLRHARVRIFRDDPGTWPSLLSTDGLTYDALEPPLSAQQRLQWLARDPNGHQSRPYEQLAAYYTAAGRSAEARRVMYAGEVILRKNKTFLPRTWSLLQDVTIGYGYQPWRAVAWLAVLLIAGSITFAVEPPPPLGSGNAPHFNPVIYSLDLLLPVVDLGQKHAFNPAGAEQWLSYLLMAAGWVLITTVAAGAARVLSRR